MIPQRPIRTLGTPASVSTIAPTGERSDFGASSERNKPIAIEIGVAIKSANRDVIAVPKMKSRAPYSSLTAFQVLPVRNPSPNSRTDGLAWSTIFQTINPNVRSVSRVAPPLRPNSVQSPHRARLAPAPVRSNRSFTSTVVMDRACPHQSACRPSVPSRLPGRPSAASLPAAGGARGHPPVNMW